RDIDHVAGAGHAAGIPGRGTRPVAVADAGDGDGGAKIWNVVWQSRRRIRVDVRLGAGECRHATGVKNDAPEGQHGGATRSPGCHRQGSSLPCKTGGCSQTKTAATSTSAKRRARLAINRATNVPSARGPASPATRPSRKIATGPVILKNVSR